MGTDGGALVVAVLALAVAVYAAIVSRRAAVAADASAKAARDTADVALRDEAQRTADRADAAVTWVHVVGSSSVWESVWRNGGSQTAFDVGVALSSANSPGGKVLYANEAEVLPGGTMSIDLDVIESDPKGWVELTWQLDPSPGSQRMGPKRYPLPRY